MKRRLEGFSVGTFSHSVVTRRVLQNDLLQLEIAIWLDKNSMTHNREQIRPKVD